MMFLRQILQASAILPFLYTSATAQDACNNSPSLCSKAYNNITHLGAHNSAFLRNQQTSFSTSGNHFYNTTVQLDAGVRMLSAQVHAFNDSGTQAWHLCHSSCSLLDAGPLTSWLTEIKTWIDRNPNDVVSLILVNSDNAPASTLGAQFASSGIDKLAYTPPSPSSIPTSWPTLDNLIANNTRLMAFVASLPSTSSDFPYLMDQYAFMFENNFENTDPSNYTCAPSRPTSLSTSAATESNRMFLMNHFLYDDSLFGIQITNVTYANTTNGLTGLGSLGESVAECSGVYGKAPTFVMVDWFNMGPAVESVDRANGVSGATGRKSVSAQPLTQGSSAGVRSVRGSMFGVVVAVVGAVVFAA